MTVETNPDSTLDVVVEIQFDPRRVTLEDDMLTDRLSVSTANYDIFYDLEGISTKPVNVKKPLAYEAKNITTSSFLAGNYNHVLLATICLSTLTKIQHLLKSKVLVYSQKKKDLKVGMQASLLQALCINYLLLSLYTSKKIPTLCGQKSISLQSTK